MYLGWRKKAEKRFGAPQCTSVHWDDKIGENLKREERGRRRGVGGGRGRKMGFVKSGKCYNNEESALIIVFPLKMRTKNDSSQNAK